jgi:hypothetical protein
MLAAAPKKDSNKYLTKTKKLIRNKKLCRTQPGYKQLLNRNKRAFEMKNTQLAAARLCACGGVRC